MVAFACGSGACWACWGTFSIAELAGALGAIAVALCVTFGGFGGCLEGFGAFEAWQTAALNAYKRSHCCGRGVLLSHCCGLVVAFACGSGACWACWGTFSLRSWPDFWRVWRVLEGFGAFEAWQTAALNAYKKPLLRPWGALEPLLWPCGGFCVREWRVLGLLGYKRGLSPGKGQAAMPELFGPFPWFWRVLEGFGAFEAWQTAALNAYKKPLLRPWGASHCCGLVVTFACGSGAFGRRVWSV